MSDIKEIAARMALVYDDCKTDATRVDETPFTPRGVGGLLGEHLAMIAAVAKSVEQLAYEVEATRRTLDARTEQAV